MDTKRDELSEEELMAMFGFSEDMPEPEVFDLGKAVVLSELTDDELLFRESIIKTFFESATRAGHPVYGYTTEVLERLHAEVVAEFKSRGRDYLPTLDRHQKSSTKDVKRSAKEIEEINKEPKLDKTTQDLIKEVAEKTAEEVLRKNSSIVFPWVSPNTTSGEYTHYGPQYSCSHSSGGDVDDTKKETSE